MANLGFARARRSAVAAMAALAVVGLGACSSAGRGGGPPTTLTIAATSSNASLDPVEGIQGWPLGIYTEIAYDPLIVRAPSGDYQPDLATEFGYVGDTNTTYAITLRDGVKFSDGTPLDAQALKDWLAYVAKSPGPGQGVFANVGSVDVDGPTRLTLHLKTPDPNLDYYLSQDQFGFPISAAAIKNPAELKSGTYGAGPYMLDRSTTALGTKFSYVQNPNYWDRSKQHWQNVVVTVVPNGNAALSAVASGQALITNVSAQLATTATGLAVTHVPTYFAGLVVLDRGGVVVPALKDPRVRQALNFAVDRDAITTSLFKNYGTPSVQGLVTGLDSYDPGLDTAYSYDPAKAKQLLAEAGYPNGFTLPIAVVPFGGQESAMAQAVAGYLNEVGVTTQLTPYSSLASGFADIAAKKVAVIPETTFYVQDIDLIVRAQLLPGLSVINPFTETPEKDMVALYDAAEAAAGPARAPALRALQDHAIRNGFFLHTSVADTIYITAPGIGPLGVSPEVPIVNFQDIAPAAE